MLKWMGATSDNRIFIVSKYLPTNYLLSTKGKMIKRYGGHTLALWCSCQDWGTFYKITSVYSLKILVEEYSRLKETKGTWINATYIPGLDPKLG